MIDQTPSNSIAGHADSSAFAVPGQTTPGTAKGGATRLDWGKLLCDWRVPYEGTDAGPPDAIPGRSQFESDYDRVVFSQPFRRLARKTQVHPMATNDHVHNRLTHSIEVASVGRSFGRRIATFLDEVDELARAEGVEPPERSPGPGFPWPCAP